MSISPKEPDTPKTSRRLAFLESISPEYLENLHEQFENDPESVAPDWAFFFELVDTAEEVAHTGSESPAPTESNETSAKYSQIALELRVHELIEAYRMRGHLLAKIDPLGLYEPPIDPHLDLNLFGLDNIPDGTKFQVAKEIGLPSSSLKTIVEHLKATYSNFIGVEFHFIRDEELRSWLMERIETNHNQTNFNSEQKIRILKHLFRASIFESFLQNNYTGQKRFSLEGSESLIPALKQVINACADLGAKEIVIGMAHRGRLNVLANVMEKPYQEIFKEFEGAELPELAEATGDVKYHQGYSSDAESSNGQKVHLSLAPNPSHLEWVNPVVEGVTRAKQDTKYSGDRKKVVPILIHGDAAIIGQGVVPETLNLANLNGYRTGGTIHIVINNQIGFTTLPHASRSSLYCTDHAKAFGAPIFHVNGDHVEDVVHAIGLACEFRMKFGRDAFVDIWSYRKYGHNEGDEPRFTQPVMYKVIEQHPSPLEIYIKRLTEDPNVSQDEVDKFSKGFKEELDRKRAEIKDSPRILKADMFRGLWQGFELSSEPKMIAPVDTSVKEADFEKVIECIHHIPSDVSPLPKFKKMLELRKKKILENDEIDWAVGEQLAFGSLILENFPVRLSGQDSIRGTFSQRHAAMRDIQTGTRYYFLHHLDPNAAKFYVYDSPLSEAAVLGFDYGYSVAQPKSLVLWEAQFGDFANSAQVIIDQFFVSAESKWYRMSGLSLLLPHGYEGQGPEHSSARLERFLQMAAQNNIQVCYPTTPAQYSHLLRRQVHRKFRKPLIVMAPKSPLRMPEVVSKKADFLNGHFHNMLIDRPKNKPKRVILCSGKIYWDLAREAKAKKIWDEITIVRLEQIYPLDKQQLLDLKKEYPDSGWFWVQEEPKNMGAWSFIKLNLLELDIPINYVGRLATASTATGSHLKHEREQRQLTEEGLGL
ncbi:MAG: 2-oxoglutarate dehydrogenase E1 component [Deltaproteobacteria bacterium CG11_big_fil_rev_8_21_14_0_20_45_16]|nr:MAG: 2-oxoglutarate dehydrogenase E1 component [Deltaproteobacteria bacterium CG11_big_fil_rev_8_21_14_0_20_45_16]